jgi:hypothetical protein
MNSNGITFNGDGGPIMTGTWFNPQTGHKFTVRDCYFQDNQFMVLTTDGQTLDYNTIQNYVQATDAQGKSQEPDNSLMKPQTEEIPPEVAAMMANDDDMLTPEDKQLLDGSVSLGNINQPQSRRINLDAQIATPQVDEDMAMTTRVLKRHSVPKLSVGIDWKSPVKQIETLVDILGIDPDTIAQYYIAQLSSEELLAQAREALVAHINKIVNPSVATDVPSKKPSKKK